MAASRKSSGERYIDRFATSRGPGWTQAARNLQEAGFRPSWAPSGKPRESDLRAIYGPHQRARLTTQERAARRKEVDAFVRSSRLSTRRVERLSESQVPRNRATPRSVFRWQTEHIDQLYVGNHDAEQRQPPLPLFRIEDTVREGYATYLGSPDTPVMAHLDIVRALLEVDYDRFPKGHPWQWYVDEARADPDRVYLTKDKAYVRIWVQQTVTRAELDAALRLAKADRTLGGTQATRFANQLFGIDGCTRVMYFGISAGSGSTTMQSRGTVG